MTVNTDNIVILEGFHVCKHAMRFNADIIELVTANKQLLQVMLSEHAPDVTEKIMDMVKEISKKEFDNYSNIIIHTPLAGKAYIPKLNISADINQSIVYLENPRDLGNIGAVVRLAAGMNCAAVVTTGDVDPWHKNCLRGSQGLHFALPVYHVDNLDSDFFDNKMIYAFDERGINISQVGASSSKQVVLAFGSERAGMSEELKKQSQEIIKIPQRDGVASYNLATSVAMGVYHVKYNL